MGAKIPGFKIRGHRAKDAPRVPSRAPWFPLCARRSQTSDCGALTAQINDSFLTFFLFPLAEFSNGVQLRALSPRSKLWCHNAINRILTLPNLGRQDALDLSRGVFTPIARPTFGWFAEVQEPAFVCTLLRFRLGVKMSVGVGVEAAVSGCEKSFSCGEISANA